MADDPEQIVINHLVKVTLDPNEWEQFRTQINAIKDAEADPAAAEAAAKAMLPTGVDPLVVERIADDYCDIFFAGIYKWDGPNAALDRDRWVRLCQTVTELTSSTVM